MPWDIPANIILLKSLLLPALFVHFAWLGVMAGGATVAVALDILAADGQRRGLATAILDRVAPGAEAVLLLGLSAALILLGVHGYPPPAPLGPFRWGTPLPLLAGLALLLLCRRLLRHGRGGPLRPGIALAGIALLLASSLLLCYGSGLLVMPEKWPLPALMPLSLFSWYGTGRYIEFTCLSFAAAGSVIMLLGQRQRPQDASFCRRLGRGMTVLSLLAWPPALLFTQFNLPATALSGGLWLLVAAGLATAGGGAWLAAAMPEGSERVRGRALLAISLTLFAIWVAGDHLARENALEEAALEGIAAILPPPAEAKMPPVAPPAEGKGVFERLCAACHRFDARVVGPPLDSVVPKYRQDPAALRAFIRDPVKRDPAYPDMPKLPLSEAEIEAVAAYLLEKAAP